MNLRWVEEVGPQPQSDSEWLRDNFCLSSVFPLPTVGFYCTVTALALSVRRLFGPAPFARGLDKVMQIFKNRKCYLNI